jgi:gluconate 5-dehydrogenase
MSKLFSLTNKVAFITGASSGLGVQYAHALARHGADLVLAARRLDKLKAVADEIEAEHSNSVLPVKCDVTQETQVKQAVEQALNQFEQIDILINNAGVADVGPTQDVAQENWQKVLDVNLTGVFLCSKHVAQHMIERSYGKIINTASMYGRVGNTHLPVAAYHASKGGVVNLTRALAAEWAKHDITVNAIGPGFFASEMTAGMEDDPDMNQFLQKMCPMQRWGQAGELDGAVVFLASDASSYMTGQTLYVDGGWTAV